MGEGANFESRTGPGGSYPEKPLYYPENQVFTCMLYAKIIAENAFVKTQC